LKSSGSTAYCKQDQIQSQDLVFESDLGDQFQCLELQLLNAVKS